MRRIPLATVFVLLLMIGCTSQSSKDGTLGGVSPDHARQLNGERNVFETSEDPPITAQTHFAAGQVCESNSDYAKAVKQYREALKLDANHRATLYRLGVCLSHLKRYPEAQGTWKKYCDLTGGDAVAFSNLGFCHELAGQFDQAESAYRQGIEKDPRNVPCRTNYGLMLARFGRYAEATIQLQVVLSRAETHYNIGSVFELQGRKEQARTEYKKALELDPTFRDAQTRLSSLGNE